MDVIDVVTVVPPFDIILPAPFIDCGIKVIVGSVSAQTYFNAPKRKVFVKYKRRIAKVDKIITELILKLKILLIL